MCVCIGVCLCVLVCVVVCVCLWSCVGFCVHGSFQMCFRFFENYIFKENKQITLLSSDLSLTKPVPNVGNPANRPFHFDLIRSQYKGTIQKAHRLVFH